MKLKHPNPMLQKMLHPGRQSKLKANPATAQHMQTRTTTANPIAKPGTPFNWPSEGTPTLCTVAIYSSAFMREVLSVSHSSFHPMVGRYQGE
jgi:hypothetical protein